MCVIAACITKDFGVIAADSATYEMQNEKTQFITPKLTFIKNKYLATFIGDPAYFPYIDYNKFDNDLASLSIYLQQYLLEVRPKVEKALKELNVKEQVPHLCLFVLGLYNKKPTLLQLNSFYNFKPKYLYSDNGPKFASIYYGDDQKKNEILSSTTRYMEKKAEKWKDMFSPGIAAEILTRGIYKKADMEQALYGKKYAGGAVSVASLMATGASFGLSNVRV